MVGPERPDPGGETGTQVAVETVEERDSGSRSLQTITLPFRDTIASRFPPESRPRT